MLWVTFIGCLCNRLFRTPEILHRFSSTQSSVIVYTIEFRDLEDSQSLNALSGMYP